mmetsp:Transcript_6446/g.9386  ORF Transcript_6446/g.9386 Transcript_6446/m.9386 type:complete len:489 (-) Transcript_6446:83-1549(-)
MIENHAPLKRYMHTCILYQNKLFIHGGMDERGSPLNDTWLFDLRKKKWKNLVQKQQQKEGDSTKKLVKTLPLPLWGSTGTVDEHGIFSLFGGHHKNGQSSSIYVLKLKLPESRSMKHQSKKYTPTVFSGSKSKRKNTWYDVRFEDDKKRPRERYLHSMVQRKHFLYVFGGYPTIADTAIYSFDLLHKTWDIETIDHHEGSKIRGRYGHACSLSNDESTMIITFGRETREYLNDCYLYHFATKTWKELPMSNQSIDHTPSERYGHSSVMSSNGSLFIFGGILPSGHKSNELFEYNVGHEKWRRVSLMINAIPRAFHSAVITSEDRMILFGGEKENRLLVAGLDEIDLANHHKLISSASPSKSSVPPRKTSKLSKAEKRREHAIKKMHQFTSSRGAKYSSRSTSNNFPFKFSPSSNHASPPSFHRDKHSFTRMGGGFQTQHRMKKSPLLMSKRYAHSPSNDFGKYLSPLKDSKPSYHSPPQRNFMSSLNY